MNTHNRELPAAIQNSRAYLRRRSLILIVISLVCYLSAELSESVFSGLFPDETPVMRTLLREYCYNTGYLFLYLLPFVITTVFYIVDRFVIKGMKERRVLKSLETKHLSDETEKKAILLSRYQSIREAAVTEFAANLLFLVALGIELTFFVTNVIALPEPVPTRIYNAGEDIKLYRAGISVSYEGALRIYFPSDDEQALTLSSDRVEADAFYNFYTEDRTYLTETVNYSGQDILRCPVELYDGGVLMRPFYLAEYLPNTKTILSIIDDEGVYRTGDGISERMNPPAPEGWWQFFDFYFQRCDGLYGYDMLSEKEQKLFDIFYSEAYFENLGDYTDEIEDRLCYRRFYLPGSFDEPEYYKALNLYKAHRPREDGFPYFYDKSGTTNITLAAAGKVVSTDEPEAAKTLSELTRQYADDFLAQMPENLPDTVKTAYIFDRLIAHMRGETSLSERKAPEDVTAYLLENAQDTASCALICGEGDSEAVSLAFDMLADQAGLSVLTIYGRYNGIQHCWNMAELDGRWYHCDITLAMEAPDDWFLVSDARLEGTHTAESICDAQEIPPPRTGTHG